MDGYHGKRCICARFLGHFSGFWLESGRGRARTVRRMCAFPIPSHQAEQHACSSFVVFVLPRTGGGTVVVGGDLLSTSVPDLVYPSFPSSFVDPQPYVK